MMTLIMNYFTMILSYGIFGLIQWLVCVTGAIWMIVMLIIQSVQLHKLMKLKKLEKEAFENSINKTGTIEIDI